MTSVTLRDYQQLDLAYMIHKGRGLFMHDPGVG